MRDVVGFAEINKKDGYKIYLKGDVIYKLCSKEEAYLGVVRQLNYRDEVNRLFDWFINSIYVFCLINKQIVFDGIVCEYCI